MVFLDISTANLELAKLLVKSSLNITVVTNMVDILLEFMVPTSVRFIFIGGSFSQGKDGFVGSIAIRQILEFHFDIAFLGIVGVDLYDNSVATYMVEDGLTKSAILDVSKTTYMMLESRKLNMDGTYKYTKIDSFTGAVMDTVAPEEHVDKMKEYNIEWL